MENNSEEKIINSLKEGEKSTTELSSIISKNYYDAIKVLNELESKEIIEKITVGNYTYWRLKKKDDEI